MPERFECTTMAKKALYKYSYFPFWRSVTLICGALEEHLLTYLLTCCTVGLHSTASITGECYNYHIVMF